MQGVQLEGVDASGFTFSSAAIHVMMYKQFTQNVNYMHVKLLIYSRTSLLNRMA